MTEANIFNSVSRKVRRSKIDIPRALQDSWRRFRDWLSSCSVTCLNEMRARDDIGIRAQRTKRVKILLATLLFRSFGCSFLSFNSFWACVRSSGSIGQSGAQDSSLRLHPSVSMRACCSERKKNTCPIHEQARSMPSHGSVNTMTSQMVITPSFTNEHGKSSPRWGVYSRSS